MGFFKKLLASSYRYFKSKGLIDFFPELKHRVPVISQLHGDANSTLNSTRDYSFHQTVSWVYAAINHWQKAISGLDLRVYDRAGKEVRNDAVEMLLERPNSDIDPPEFWSGWAQELGITGETNFEVERNGNRIIDLWPHFSRNVWVKPDEKNVAYNKISSFRLYSPGVFDYQLGFDEVLRWKFRNVFKPLRGLSLITALRYAVTAEVFSQRWNNAFFRNGARPDYAIVAPEGLTKDERDAYIAEYQANYGLQADGEFGYGKPLILEKGITDAKPLNFTPKDMEWLNQRRMSRDEIGAVFGVPRELMFVDVAKYENLEKAEELFWTLTMLPLIRMRDSGLTKFLRDSMMLSPRESVRTDLSKVIPLQRVVGSMIDQAQQFSQMGVPFNLINEHYAFGFPRYDADMVSAPFGTETTFGGEGEVLDEGDNVNETE